MRLRIYENGSKDKERAMDLFTFLQWFWSTPSSPVKIMATETHPSTAFRYGDSRSRGVPSDNIGNSPARPMSMRYWRRDKRAVAGQACIRDVDDPCWLRSSVQPAPEPPPVFPIVRVARTSDRS